MGYILIAEDEYSIQLLLSRILKDIGHQVKAVNNGVEALAELKRNKPDIVLTDLKMPRMSGLELIAIIRRDFPNMSIIAVSAHNESAQLALKLNKVHQLPKPFTKRELVSLINTVLSTAHTT